MSRKVYKKIKQDNGTLTIWGSNRWIKIDYAQPEWSDDLEPYFRYEGRRHYLSEILHTRFPNAPEWIKEFDGYTNDSFFSGILVKLSNDGEAVKAFTFCS